MGRSSYIPSDISSKVQVPSQKVQSTSGTGSSRANWSQSHRSTTSSDRYKFSNSNSSGSLADSGYYSRNDPKSSRLPHGVREVPPPAATSSSMLAEPPLERSLRSVPSSSSSLSPLTSSPHTLTLPVPATLTVSKLVLSGKEGEKEGEGSSPRSGEGGETERIKLERERSRVRQLEHEVSVLEQQLSEKTRASVGYVEELTCMRSELARERAALTMVSDLWG